MKKIIRSVLCLEAGLFFIDKKIHNSEKYTREKFGDDIIKILDRYRDIIE